MTVHDCPRCKVGTKGIVIMSSSERMTFHFPLSLSTCACELTTTERLQMAAAAIQERLSEQAAAPESGSIAAGNGGAAST